MKRTGKTSGALLLAALLTLPAGCAAGAPAPKEGDPGRLQIVTTLFPQYDFARQLAGELADAALLLPPGVESHTYEPTPRDVERIAAADLFLYTGPEMEPWAQTLLDGTNGTVRAVDLSQGIALDAAEDAGEEHAGHHHHTHDPHIWTSPVNARVMARSVADALCQADPANAEAYRGNAAAYDAQLAELDETLRAVVEGADRREVVFAGRFALHYLCRDYGLTAVSAYGSCSEEAEPSVRDVARIIDQVRAQRIPVIYCEELVDPKVARTIAEETGARVLELHSVHNVSRRELEAGETYLSLMRRNAAHLREGLYGWL